MRQNWQQYQPFVEGGLSVEQYCQKCIDPHAKEIDHLGIQAAFDAVISGAGMCIQIFYLDRSDGVDIKPMVLEPLVADGQQRWKSESSTVDHQSMSDNPPAMTLLYRPYVMPTVLL